MKTIMNLLLIIIAAFGFQACNDDDAIEEEIIEKTIIVGIEEKIPIHADQTIIDPEFPVEIWGPAVSRVAGEATLSIDNKDTHDYLNKILSVEILSLRYKVVDFKGNDNDLLCGAVLSIHGITMEKITTELNIRTVTENGVVYTVSLPSQINIPYIEANIKKSHQVQSKFEGTGQCFKGNMDFNVQVMMQVKVTVNAL